MYQKAKPYCAYILAGALGILTFILSAFSGIVSVTKYVGQDMFDKSRSTETTYKFMDFLDGSGAWNAAGVFEILLIVISVALITFAVFGILNKMGKTKISLGKLAIEDLLMYITFAYTIFALCQTICAGVFVGDVGSYTSEYVKSYLTVGAGPLLMLFVSAALATYQILTKWVFNKKAPAEKKAVAKVEPATAEATPKTEVAPKTTTKKAAVKPAAKKAPAKKAPAKKSAAKK